jgi:hypothetical protein
LGFGSFNFQATKRTPDSFTGAEYFGWIEREMRRIPGASVVDVSTFDPSYLVSAWPSPSVPTNYSRSGDPYPALQFSTLKFGLKISEDDQRRLLPLVESPPLAETEHFIVSIRDGWQMPTAMVWPVGADGQEGSRAVQVVREFLRQEVGLGPDAPIEFDCLGPSPAHFTVELDAGTSAQTEAFHLLRREPAPYPNYVFSYGPHYYENVASAVDDLHFEITSQLDLLYRISAARSARLFEWADAENDARRILNAYKGRGPHGWVRQRVHGRNIGRVQIALVQLELNQSLDEKRLAREFEAEYSEPKTVNIERVVKDELQGFETVDVEPLSKLMEVLASARQTGRAVLIAAVASLIGAAVAAVATVVAH